MKLLILSALLLSNTAFALSIDEFIHQAKEPIIIADKTNATLAVYYPNSKKLLKTEALFGINKSDVLPSESLNTKEPLGITPSGLFTIKKYYSLKLRRPVLALKEKEGNIQILSIHSVWLGKPEQNRLERLNSKSSKDNRITNGCINVRTDFFYEVLYNIKDNTKILILNEEQKL
jgi:hypothetical protein